jgi:DNA-binding MarR family transcriptional regulator
MPFVEMLFFAYRDFTGEADAALAAYDLGRAHHRVLHFVNRHPAIRVADLLELLKITKQSLSRVLRRLVADGWIEHVPGPEDRRERHLTLTPRGRTLAAELAALQTRRIQAALGAIDATHGAEARNTVRQFLLALIAEDERAEVTQLVGGGVAPAGTPNLGGA